MRKAVIIGAGKTGRGFIGRLAKEANCEILFVDKNAGLVDQLNQAGRFSVSFFGGERDEVIVDHFKASTWEHADLSDAELIFVAVGGQNLPDVGSSLRTALPTDCIHHIIVCENASSPAEKLMAAMGREDVHASEATVFCTTIESTGLDVASENYPYLQCNADKLGGYTPFIPSVQPVGSFDHFLTRKLYTYNAASCVIAYLGGARGYTVYSDAANDPDILALLDRNYAATNRAMCLEFGYGEDAQVEFAQLSRVKFTSTAIRDTVERNGRDVARKLAPGERVIGIMQLIGKHGGDTTVLEMTTAAALIYTFDSAWQARVNLEGREAILRSFCKLDNPAQITRILTYAERLSCGNFKPID